MTETLYFETHCHLNNAQYATDLITVLERARQAGVRALTVIGWDLDSSRAAVELARRHPGLHATVGVHPHEVEEWGPEMEASVREMARDPAVVAIGEIGLDFYRDLSPREKQYEAFRAQLEMAAELGLPIVVHTRESVGPAMDVIEPFAPDRLRGVMHCWSGTVEEARRARDFGFMLGIGGVLTYKKPGDLPDVVLDSPLESLVLETDCPYLAPTPHRGKRNEPAYLPLTAERLAAIKELPLEQVASVTFQNAARLFNIGSASNSPGN